MNVRKLFGSGKYLLFFVIPVLFTIAGVYVKSQFTHYDLSSVDPEMAYLYNGLMITQGWICHFVDHPGIPLQYISAGVILVVNLFRDLSIEEDVIKNPNLYIHAITYTIIIIQSLLLLFVGIFSARLFKNIFAGLLIQLTPFISVYYLGLAGRLLPEYFSLTAIILLFLLISKYVHDIENGIIRKKWFYPLGFALILGFAISIKITLATIGIIPFIVIKGYRNKLLYILFSVLSTVFFLIPAINRWNYFSGWVSGLFIHSGQYGQGDANIVDVNLYKENIISINENFHYLIYLVGAFIILGLLYLIPKLKLKVKNDPLYYSFVCFTLVSFVSILIIAKQLKLCYIQPYVLMLVPTLFLSLLILQRNDVLKKIIFPVAFFILLLFSFWETLPAFACIQSNSTDRQYTQEIINEKYRDLPIAAVSNYYGSPYFEYSVHYGGAYSPKKRRQDLLPVILKISPDFYSYHSWNKRFNYWDGSSYSLTQLVNNYDSLYLYLGDQEMFNYYQDKLSGINKTVEFKKELLFSNYKTGEYLYKVVSTRNKDWSIKIDFDSIDSGGLFVDKDNQVKLWNNKSESNLHSLSGNYSSQTSVQNPFGFIGKLSDVELGEIYTFSAWKLKNGNINSSLVFEVQNMKKLYIMGSGVIEEKNGWQRIQIQLIINDNLYGEKVNFFTNHNNDSIPAFWDDVLIEKTLPNSFSASIKAVNKKYIGILSDENTTNLSADKDNAGSSEFFTFIEVDKNIYIIVNCDGKYWGEGNCNDGVLIANSDIIGEKEKFTVRIINGKYMSIKSSNGKFVSINNNGHLSANAERITKNEIFEIKYNYIY